MKKLTLGLAADPGLPLAMARRLRERLADELEERVDDGVAWTVEIRETSLPIDADGAVALSANSQVVRHQNGWDYIIYVTDLPKYVRDEPLLSTVNTSYGSAMVVLPSLGLAPTRRLGRVIVDLAAALHETVGPGLGSAAKDSLTRRSFSVEDEFDDAQSHHAVVTVKGVLGRLLMQAGMVRSNQPFRLVPKLSAAMAAASAAGAFGIFYTNIWSMADYLSTPRLLLISLLSVTVMTVWLITTHGLLERPQGAKWRERRLTYNTATLLTVLLAVTTMFLFLFVVILIGALVVINAEYMTDQLGHAVGLPEYLNLAWLSASMGIIAGAVGSGLSDADAVRKATFSNREYVRRQIILGRGSEPDGPAATTGEAEAAADTAELAATSAAEEAGASARSAEEAHVSAREVARAQEAAAGGPSRDGDRR